MRLRERIHRFIYRRIITFLRGGLDSVSSGKVGIDPEEEAQAIFARGVPYRSASGDLKSRGFDGSGLDGIAKQYFKRAEIHNDGLRGRATAQGQY